MISGVPKISRFPIPNPRLISVRNLETLGQRNWMNVLKQLNGMKNWGKAIFLGLHEGSAFLAPELRHLTMPPLWLPSSIPALLIIRWVVDGTLNHHE